MNRYLQLTKTHSYSLLFVFPLLVLYELGALYMGASGSGFRNGADVLLRTVLIVGGVNGTLALAFALLAAGGVIVVLERRRRPVPLKMRPFTYMMGESILYALLLGSVVGGATQWILNGIPLDFSLQNIDTLPVVEGIILSMGAGFYEELVFRVLLAGGLFAVFRASGLTLGQAGAAAVLLSALIFSGFHYIGPYGDAWGLPSFLFRLLAGVAFSALFLLRGFGIAAWTHALYDIFLVLTLRG